MDLVKGLLMVIAGMIGLFCVLFFIGNLSTVGMWALVIIYCIWITRQQH